MIPKEIEKLCECHFFTHKATLIQNTERYLIIDWRRADGSNKHYVNYIVDKLRGSLIVSGDLGDSIATWYNPIDPSNLKNYIKDVNYYIGKFQCSSDKYVYELENVIEGIKDCIEDEEIQYFIENYDDFGIESVDEFWERVKEEVSESMNGNNFLPTDELMELICKVDSDAWEWISDCGRSVDMRVYLWADGFRRACEQLEI